MTTRTELAGRLGVTLQALRDWKRDGAPVDEALAWPLADAVELLNDWRRGNKRPTYKDAITPNPDGTLQEQLLAAQIRKNNAEAEAKEMKNAERRGELIEAEAAAQQVAIALSILTARFEQIPDEARKELPADCRESVSQRIDELINLALRECAAKLRSASDETTP